MIPSISISKAMLSMVKQDLKEVCMATHDGDGGEFFDRGPVSWIIRILVPGGGSRLDY